MTPLHQIPNAIENVSRAATELLNARISLQESTWIIKSALIVDALKRTGGNKSRAARLLRIHRNLLERDLQLLNLNPFAGDVKKVSELQMELFSRKRPASSVGTAKGRSAAA